MIYRICLYRKARRKAGFFIQSRKKEDKLMRTYEVTITETLTRTVSVEAEGCADAEDIVRARYGRGEIVLVAEDIADTEITAEHEGICPLCGAEIEYAGENVIDDDGGRFPWQCPGCGTHGDEGYVRHFDGHWNVEA